MTDPTPETTPTRDEAVRELLQSNLIAPGLYATSTVFARGRAAMAAEALTLLASAPAPAGGRVDVMPTVPARDGTEARRGLNDVFPGDPYPVQTILADIRQRHVQAIGAGLSRHDWHATETAYNSLRDATDDLLRRLQRAPLSPAATPVSGADMIPRAKNVGRYLAETNDGRLLYLNHATEWQEMPNILANPASSPAGGDVVQTLIDKTEKLIEAADDMGWSCNSSSADQAIREAKDAVRAALSQSTSAGRVG